MMDAQQPTLENIEARTAIIGKELGALQNRKIVQQGKLKAKEAFDAAVAARDTAVANFQKEMAALSQQHGVLMRARFAALEEARVADRAELDAARAERDAARAQHEATMRRLTDLEARINAGAGAPAGGGAAAGPAAAATTVHAAQATAAFGGLEVDAQAELEKSKSVALENGLLRFDVGAYGGYQGELHITAATISTIRAVLDNRATVHHPDGTTTIIVANLGGLHPLVRDGKTLDTLRDDIHPGLPKFAGAVMTALLYSSTSTTMSVVHHAVDRFLNAGKIESFLKDKTAVERNSPEASLVLVGASLRRAIDRNRTTSQVLPAFPPAGGGKSWLGEWTDSLVLLVDAWTIDSTTREIANAEARALNGSAAKQEGLSAAARSALEVVFRDNKPAVDDFMARLHPRQNPPPGGDDNNARGRNDKRGKKPRGDQHQNQNQHQSRAAAASSSHTHAALPAVKDEPRTDSRRRPRSADMREPRIIAREHLVSAVQKAGRYPGHHDIKAERQWVDGVWEILHAPPFNYDLYRNLDPPTDGARNHQWTGNQAVWNAAKYYSNYQPRRIFNGTLA